MPRKSGRLQGTTKPAEEQSLSSLPQSCSWSKQICSSEHKGTFASHSGVPSHSHSHPPGLYQTPLIGSPHLSLWPILLCPQKMVCLIPKWWHPSPGSTLATARKLHSKPPLRRGEAGLCPPWKMPGTIHYVPCSAKARQWQTLMSCQCPESSPSLWLSPLLSEPLFPHLWITAWMVPKSLSSSQTLVATSMKFREPAGIVVKLRASKCGSTGIWGAFRPLPALGKKKVFGELSSKKNSYPSLPGHKKNQVLRALPTKPTATQLNMVSL